MTVLDCPGGTGDYRTNLASKAAVLARGLDPAGGDYEFGFLHVKAVDDAGHDRKVNYKVAYLSAVDVMVAQLAARLAAIEARIVARIGALFPGPDHVKTLLTVLPTASCVALCPCVCRLPAGLATCLS